MNARIPKTMSIVALAGLFVCAFLFAACGGSDKTETPAAQKEAPQAAPAPAEDAKFKDWIEFSTETDGFAITTPKSFEKSQETTKTEAGDVLITIYLSEMPTAAYGVTCNDFSEDLVKGKDPEILLRGGAKGFAEHLNGSVSSEKMISLGDFKGMEIILTGSSEGVPLYAKGRFYLVKTKLYQVAVVAEKGKEDAAAIDKFLDSFKLK